MIQIHRSEPLVHVGDQLVRLTRSEHRLLTTLGMCDNRVVPHAELLDVLCQSRVQIPADRMVLSANITRLRKKLGEDVLQSRRKLGYQLRGQVVVCSEIDAQDASRNAAGWHSTVYPAFNTLLRNGHSFADGFADLGSNAALQDATNTTYFNADKVHLTEAGYDVVAGIVGTALAAL